MIVYNQPMPWAQCQTPERQIWFELYKVVHKRAAVCLSCVFCMILNWGILFMFGVCRLNAFIQCFYWVLRWTLISVESLKRSFVLWTNRRLQDELTLVFSALCWSTVELLTGSSQTWTSNRSALDHRSSDLNQNYSKNIVSDTESHSFWFHSSAVDSSI